VLDNRGITSARKENLHPTASGIVCTWLAMTPEQQATAASRPAEPIYVRPPHITASVRKPWEI
jgi:hypothetical protein